MILTFCRLTVQAGKRKELRQTLRLLVTQMKMESGCVDSAFFQHADDENDFLLIGTWENREALNDHLQSVRFTVLMGTRCLLSRPPEVVVHTVAQSLELKTVHSKTQAPGFSPDKIPGGPV